MCILYPPRRTEKRFPQQQHIDQRETKAHVVVDHRQASYLSCEDPRTRLETTREGVRLLQQDPMMMLFHQMERRTIESGPKSGGDEWTVDSGAVRVSVRGSAGAGQELG